MRYINIAHPEQVVSFSEALVTGLGRGQGLFFPEKLSPFENLQELLEMDFVTRSSAILEYLIEPAMSAAEIRDSVEAAFNFPVKLKQVGDGIGGTVFALELFHGPSLAFKDFGARFMAQCLSRQNSKERITILTATSGDTGAAVAQAFYKQAGIDVVVLYPKGMVTPLQEKMFCTLGDNIHTIAIEDDFDACQQLVKQSFDDHALVETIGMNSANSINVARLLAQVCYYFEAIAQLPTGSEAVFSVPSGNFGNVTAGLLACALGLPIKRIIAATNINDTVPRYLASGQWEPQPTVATLTNAMDISLPNNFPRVLELGDRHQLPLEDLLSSISVDDEQTRASVKKLDKQGYVADPHSALAYKALTDDVKTDETGVFVCTAHPAKFRETMEQTLNREIPLPPELRDVADKDVLSTVMPASFDQLREYLLKL